MKYLVLKMYTFDSLTGHNRRSLSSSYCCPSVAAIRVTSEALNNRSLIDCSHFLQSTFVTVANCTEISVIGTETTTGQSQQSFGRMHAASPGIYVRQNGQGPGD